MGIVFGLTVAYVVRRIITCPEGRVFALKELFAQVYLRILRYVDKRRLDTFDLFEIKDLRRGGILFSEEEIRLESKRETEEASNVVLIYGVNTEGDKLFVRVSVLRDHSVAALQLYLAETKTSYVLPDEVLYRVPKGGQDCFVAGGLRLRCLAPFRKWRISFNGLLKTRSDDDEADHHVKFNFLWTSSSGVFDARDNIHEDLLSNFLAQSTWNGWRPTFHKFSPYLDTFVQGGNLVGTVVVDGEEEREVNLWGHRVRKMEKQDLDLYESSTEFFGYTKQGDSFNLETIKFTECPKELQFGFTTLSTQYEGEIKSFKDQQSGKTVQFQRGEKEHTVETLNCHEALEFTKSFNGTKTTFKFCNITFNGGEGVGFMCSTVKNSSPLKLEKKKDVSQASPELFLLGRQEKRIVSFLEELCKDTNVSGGKGSSLATLAQLHTYTNECIVPKGFVVSTHAYKEFIESLNIENQLSLLEKVVWGDADSDVPGFCKALVEKMVECQLPVTLKSELTKMMIEVFGKGYESSRFAVRSSAVGEDSEELSAAGQMETFLGVQGIDKVMTAVVKCWASQFSFTAVQYKRQNGQILNSTMAVVVQEMVAADVAGVMFMCDPLDGNPGKITIAANYGLGETVVSATAEPDTITLKKSSDGNVSYSSESIGRKHVKVVMNEMDGVKEESCLETESGKCCMSQSLALKLAGIGMKIENEFGSPMDIEWAAKGDQIYLLQARPVTTFDTETDFEISHEFDFTIRCEEDYNSKCNVGEVLPGAFTILGMETFRYPIISESKRRWSRRMGKKKKDDMNANPYIQKGIGFFQNQAFIGLMEAVLRFYDKSGSSTANAYALALCGRVLDDPEMLEVASRRQKDYLPVSRLVGLYIIKDILTSEKNVNQDVKRLQSFSIPTLDSDDAETTFHKIVSEFPRFSMSGGAHSECTVSASLLNVVLLSVLASANGGWDENVYEDFARVLVSCKDVESADVPASLQKLASTILEDNRSFNGLKTEDAMFWLRSSDSPSAEEFQKFIDKHGHRCVKEFDVYSKPWREDSVPLVKILQDMVGKVSPKTEEGPLDISATLLKTNVSLNWKQRLILKLVIPQIRKMVCLRERSKSLLIKLFDGCRKAFRILASKMVAEGRLPEPDLLYFLSLNEIDVLLKTRSPKLVQKAIRRKNMHPKLDKLKFPEIVRGVPKPLPEIKPVIPEGDLVIKGTPVSRGIVQAKARVAKTLEEASGIQSGEILIAYSTDVGWSPYFPMLSGVATELGGLISHGAVVAREYGLPCVVAVHGATDFFKSGDTVILDGNKGTLTRVSLERPSGD